MESNPPSTHAHLSIASTSDETPESADAAGVEMASIISGRQAAASPAANFLLFKVLLLEVMPLVDHYLRGLRPKSSPREVLSPHVQSLESSIRIPKAPSGDPETSQLLTSRLIALFFTGSD